MNITHEGIKLIKEFEGCSLKWYALADGMYTVGYGYAIPVKTAQAKGIRIGDRITQAQADTYLENSLKTFAGYVDTYLKKYGFTHLNDNQKNALLSYCYNRGPGGLNQLLANSKTEKDIGHNIVIYWGSNVTYKNGLIRRRKAEQVLFNTPTHTSKKKEYYTTNPRRVISLKNINMYKTPELKKKDKVVSYPKGTPFTIEKVVKSKGGTPRLKTASGLYISANKNLVKKV